MTKITSLDRYRIAREEDRWRRVRSQATENGYSLTRRNGMYTLRESEGSKARSLATQDLRVVRRWLGVRAGFASVTDPLDSFRL
jgi:hypothetical protein